MKVEIKYEYKASDICPYKAYTYLGESCVYESDKLSFERAKELLLEKVSQLTKTVPPIIPEPEEVEVA